jgi:hypothetical protein
MAPNSIHFETPHVGYLAPPALEVGVLMLFLSAFTAPALDITRLLALAAVFANYRSNG